MDFFALIGDVPLTQVGEIIPKIIAVILIIFLALLIHELGHFIAARLLGVPVKSVQIGHGKKHFERTDKKETLWRIGLMPLGAHVDLTGMDARPYWQRALVILGGPLINLAVPFVLFTAFYLSVGQPSAPPYIVGIEPGLIADEAGLQPGDKILAIDGQPVLSFKDIWREGYERGLSEKIYKIERAGQVFDTALSPEWTEYVDDGIKRAHPRLGILWDHTAFKLSAILSVDGQDTKDKPELARELLLKKFDHPMVVAIKGPEGEPLVYRVLPRSSSNPHFSDPKHREHDTIYFGAQQYNFYLHKAASTQVYDAFHYAAGRIADMATLPLQVLPIDPYIVRDVDAVTNPETGLTNGIYAFVHGLALGSILMALINLLPLPGLDGGYIVMQGIEAARGRPLSRRAKAQLFAGAFLALYLSVLFSNIDNVPGYIDSRLKKVHEFIIKNHDK